MHYTSQLSCHRQLHLVTAKALAKQGDVAKIWAGAGHMDLFAGKGTHNWWGKGVMVKGP